MSINSNFDVVIVGAGPVGLATACSLRVTNPNMRICVLDKRPDPIRSHGLYVARDAISAINEVLVNSLKQVDESNKQNVRELVQLLNSWKATTIRTNVMEKTLAERARKLGVEVLRKQEYEEVLNPETIDQVFTPVTDSDSKVAKELKSIFSSAQVVIGADGAHSTVRKKFMNDQLVDKENLQYFIELKFFTPQKARKRKPLASSLQSSSYSDSVSYPVISFETIAKSQEGQKIKPVTKHFLVNKETYESFMELQENGVIKGQGQNAWLLNEIEQRAKTNREVRRIFRVMQDYLNTKHAEVLTNNELLQKAVIRTIPLNLYRSQNAFIRYLGKFIILSGDSLSGMIFARGLNKGLREAARCVIAVGDFFKRLCRSAQVLQESTPQEFERYSRETQHIFSNERWWARFKSRCLKLAETILKVVLAPFKLIAWCFKRLFKKKAKPVTGSA